MTSWPWMKGVEVAIADPIPPVHDRDDRPAIQDLIEQHRKAIDEVKAALTADENYDATKHDDLWILRFLKSHKLKIKPSVKAAKETLLFRKEHKLDEKDIRYHPFAKDCPSDAVKRYLEHCPEEALRLIIPDPKQGVIGIITMALMDQHALVKNVSEDDWLPVFTYVSERTHQWVDYISRTTGRLTKSIRLGDMEGMKLSSVSNEMNKRDSRAMGKMENLYPQMLQQLFVCHPPAWIQIPWRILRPVFPKRLVEKIDFVNPAHNEKEKKRILKYISEENVPTRFGGKHDGPVDFPLPQTS